MRLTVYTRERFGDAELETSVEIDEMRDGITTNAIADIVKVLRGGELGQPAN